MELLISLALAAAVATSANALHRTTPPLDHPVTSWGERDGLPSSHVYAVAQDAEGYIWLGTGAGLFRFDGARFQPRELPAAIALTETAVLALGTSKDGCVWVGYAPNGGITRFCGNRVTSYTAKEGLPPGFVTTFYEDPKGTTWAGGAGFVARLRGERWESIGTLPGFNPSNVVRAMREDGRGRLWIAGDAGLFTYSSADQGVRTWSDEATSAIAVDASGTVWATQERGLISIANGADGILETAPGAVLTAQHLLIDHRNRFWISQRDSGVIILDSEPSRGVRSFSLNRQNGLRSESVTAFMEDRDRNIWIASDGGLTRVGPNRSPLRMRPELRDIVVRCVDTEPSGITWVGTAEGLVRLGGDEVRWFSRESGLPGSNISAVHVDRSGELWVATNGGLARRSGNRFITPAALSKSPLTDVTAMTTDMTGTLWVLDRRAGLARFNDGHWVGADREPSSLLSHPSAAFADTRNRVWVGLDTGGVLLYEGGKHTSTLRAADGLAPGRVNAITEDPLGHLWFSTQGGVSRWSAGQLATLTQRRGLLGSGAVTGLIADGHSHYWLGTNRGIMRIAKTEIETAASEAEHELLYELLDASDGLEGGPIWSGHPGAAQSDDGRLWFVTSGGLASITPVHTAPTSPPIPVRIEQVQYDNTTSVGTTLSTLPPLVSRIQIDYAALSFGAQGRTRFRYKLEGYDTNWVDAGSARSAVFTNLPPKEYRFIVSAKALGSAWPRETTAWSFTIRPAFYQTWLFQGSLATLLTIALVAAFQLRAKQHRRQLALIIDERARLSREMHDTLLQGMAGTALHLGFISQALPIASSERISTELTDARRRLESYIRETRRKIWDLRSESLATGDLPGAIRAAIATLAVDHSTRIDVTVDGTPSSSDPTVQEHVLRIAHEAVLNAVKHAACSVVTVSLSFIDDTLALTVTDNGLGITPPSPDGHAHWGLIGMRERAQKIGALFTVRSLESGGTEVQAIVPRPSEER